MLHRYLLVGVVPFALLLALPVSGLEPAGKKDAKETPVLALLAGAKKGQFSQDRIEAINKLGQVRESDLVGRHRVVEFLVEIVKDESDDPFVRAAAVDALCELQMHVFQYSPVARVIYQPPVTEALVSEKCHLGVRKAACRLYGQTLNLELAPDKRIHLILLDLLEGKGRYAGLNQKVPTPLRSEAARALSRLPVTANTLRCITDTLAQFDLDSRLKESLMGALDGLLAGEGPAGGPPPHYPSLLLMAKNLAQDKKAADELRAKCVVLIARLKKAGVLEADVREIATQLLKATDTGSALAVACVRALSLVGEDQDVPLLLKTYRDYFDPANTTRAGDLVVRRAVVQAAVNAVAYQAPRSNPNAAIVKDLTDFLLTTSDPQKGETPELQNVALLGLRYLYANSAAFDAPKRAALARLLRQLKEQREGAAKETILKVLEDMTQQDFGDDLDRWKKWYQERFREKLPE